MHGFLHIMLLEAKSGKLVAAIDNLSLDNLYYNLDFLQIIKDQGIDLTNRESLRHTSEIQIRLEKVQFPLIYHFIAGENLILVIVATQLNKKLANILELLMEELENNHLEEFIDNSEQNTPATDENSNLSDTNILTKNREENPSVSNEMSAPKKAGNHNHIKKETRNKNSSGSMGSHLNSEKSMMSEKISKISAKNEEEDEENEEETIDVNERKKYYFLRIIAPYISEYLLPSFLIPEIKTDLENSSSLEDDHFFHLIAKVCEKDYKIHFMEKIWAHLDGTWTMQEFSELYEIDLDRLREILFFLWKSEYIIFRLPYYDWDVFIATIKAPLFLDEGSTENLSLIDKYNSKKIIQLIDFIGEGKSYQNIVNNFDMTKTKLNQYLSDCLQQQIIRREEFKPQLEHIPEDLVPLLTMQGFIKSDFTILNKLAVLLTGNQSLRSAALDLRVDPQRIKKLLDKYETAIKIVA